MDLKTAEGVMSTGSPAARRYGVLSALLVFLIWPAPDAAAQEPAGGASTKGDCSPVVVGASGEVTINVDCRLALNPKELEELRQAVAALSRSSERLSALPADLLDRHERLSRQFGVQDQALQTFFRILNEENVPVEELDEKLREIAGRHRQALVRLAELDATDETVAGLRDRATEALRRGDYAAADQALKQAQDAQDKLVKQAEQALVVAAELRARRAELQFYSSKDWQSGRGKAAKLFQEAAELMPGSRPREKAKYLLKAADHLLSFDLYKQTDVSLDQVAGLIRRAVALQDSGPGEYDGTAAYLLARLAFAYERQERYTEAERFYKQAIIFYEGVKVEGGLLDEWYYRKSLAEVFHDLARLYSYRLNRPKEAEVFYKRALAIYEARLKENNPDEIASLTSDVTSELMTLAQLYEEQERYTEAERCYKRAIVLYENVKDRDSLALTFRTLADLYFDKLQRYDEAEEFYKRAIAALEGIEEDHELQKFGIMLKQSRLASVLEKLAQLYLEIQRYDEAERACKRALAIHQRLHKLDPDGFGVFNISYTMITLARIYSGQGRVDAAVAVCKRNLALMEAEFGKDSDALFIPLLVLGRLYEKHKRYAEAEHIYKRMVAQAESYDIEEESNGYLALALQVLARFHFNQRRYEDAAALLKRSLAICEAGLGKDHAKTKLVRQNLITVQGCTRRPEGCLKNRKELEIVTVP